jgi:hypothetical protein
MSVAVSLVTRNAIVAGAGGGLPLPS